MLQLPEIFILAILFILSFCLTFFYKSWALKRSLLDIPCERSSHTIPTPTGAGISFVIAFYTGLSFLYFTCHLEKDLFFALLPGIFLTFVGFVDDCRKLNMLTRILTQILCSGIALFFLGGMHPLFGSNLLWLWSIVALFGIVWFINLFNFIDGSDGYASMEAISVSLALCLFTGMNVFLLLAFSVGGFLYWNWPKAKVFMGDSGSLTLGFILVVFGIHFHNNGTLNFFFWILITSLFWFDATVTLFHRIINKEKLCQAHKNHMYQRAILGGFSHLKTLISGLVINILLFFICFIIWRNFIPLFFGILLSLIILGFAMYYIDQKFAFKSK